MFGITITYIKYFGEPSETGHSVHGLMSLPLILIWIIYFPVIETFFGATAAHLLFDLRVVTVERQKVTFSQSIKRHLVDPIDYIIYGIPAFITIKYTERHQRIGDLLAGTIVIDVSDPEQVKPRDESGENAT